MSVENEGKPLISIILPTYNRAVFLESAISSIRSQIYQNWELICVDDGSSDGSFEILETLTKHINQPVQLIKQENAGPAKARNRGIKEGRGEFFAFFDSDDLWKPSHLDKLISVFESHPQTDWAYSACIRIDANSGETILPSTFYSETGVANKLFEIAKKDGHTYQLDSQKALEIQLNEGIDSGLQNSMVKREVFETFLIPEYRIGEDRLLIAKVLSTGFQMRFIDEVTVEYYVHEQNISVTNKNADWQKKAEGMEALIESYEDYPRELNLTPKQLNIFYKKLSNTIFWEYGYGVLKIAGQNYKAREAFWKGIKYSPKSLRLWKTLLLNELSCLKLMVMGGLSND